jgi:hypothetical protein
VAPLRGRDAEPAGRDSGSQGQRRVHAPPHLAARAAASGARPPPTALRIEDGRRVRAAASTTSRAVGDGIAERGQLRRFDGHVDLLAHPRFEASISPRPALASLAAIHRHSFTGHFGDRTAAPRACPRPARACQPARSVRRDPPSSDERLTGLAASRAPTRPGRRYQHRTGNRPSNRPAARSDTCMRDRSPSPLAHYSAATSSARGLDAR